MKDKDLDMQSVTHNPGGLNMIHKDPFPRGCQGQRRRDIKNGG